MANKQKLAAVALGGAKLKKKIQSVPRLAGAQKIVADEDSLSLWKTAVDVSDDYLTARRKLLRQNIRIKAAATLGLYQQQLGATTTLEDFDEADKNAMVLFEKDVKEEADGEEFWNECGAEMLSMHQKDVAQLRREKECEFGRNSLDNLLSDSENILATAHTQNAEKLFKQGISEIDETPFLSDEERPSYRQHYLKTSILNMALFYPEVARKSLQEYLPDDADLKAKIEETERLQQKAREQAISKQQQEKYLADLTEACALWQKKEEGTLSEAQYFVLTDGKEKFLEPHDDATSEMPLVQAYQFVRGLNNKNHFELKDLQTATANLSEAYKQGQLGLDEVASLQNQLLFAVRDQKSAKLLFDKTPDDLADKILAADTDATTPEAKFFMEQKAKLAFEIYDTYYTQKMTLSEDFMKNGGVMTAGVIKQISRKAMQNVNQMFGFEVGEEVYSFEELNQTLADVSSLKDKEQIWRRFVDEAPYTKQKKTLLARLVNHIGKPVKAA